MVLKTKVGNGLMNGRLAWVVAVVMFGSGSVGGYALNEKVTANKERITEEKKDRIEMKRDINKKFDRIDKKLDKIIDRLIK